MDRQQFLMPAPGSKYQIRHLLAFHEKFLRFFQLYQMELIKVQSRGKRSESVGTLLARSDG